MMVRAGGGGQAGCGGTCMCEEWTLLTVWVPGCNCQGVCVHRLGQKRGSGNHKQPSGLMGLCAWPTPRGTPCLIRHTALVMRQVSEVKCAHDKLLMRTFDLTGLLHSQGGVSCQARRAPGGSRTRVAYMPHCKLLFAGLAPIMPPTNVWEQLCSIAQRCADLHTVCPPLSVARQAGGATHRLLGMLQVCGCLRAVGRRGRRVDGRARCGSVVQCCQSSQNCFPMMFHVAQFLAPQAYQDGCVQVQPARVWVGVRVASLSTPTRAGCTCTEPS